MMKDSECELHGASEDENRRACYLLTRLNRLSARVPEWQPLVLATLMQHRLGHLGTAPLLALLLDAERLAWFWVLCGTSKTARMKRIQKARLGVGRGM